MTSKILIENNSIKACGNVEIADILRQHIKDYQKKYSLSPEQYKIVYDLLNCRTEYLGGHWAASLL